MAQIVFGAAASRSPLVSAPPEYWLRLGERDQRNARMRDGAGRIVSYEEMLAEVAPSVAEELTEEAFRETHWRVQGALVPHFDGNDNSAAFFTCG